MGVNIACYIVRHFPPQEPKVRIAAAKALAELASHAHLPIRGNEFILRRVLEGLGDDANYNANGYLWPVLGALTPCGDSRSLKMALHLLCDFRHAGFLAKENCLECVGQLVDTSREPPPSGNEFLEDSFSNKNTKQELELVPKLLEMIAKDEFASWTAARTLEKIARNNASAKRQIFDSLLLLFSSSGGGSWVSNVAFALLRRMLRCEEEDGIRGRILESFVGAAVARGGEEDALWEFRSRVARALIEHFEEVPNLQETIEAFCTNCPSEKYARRVRNAYVERQAALRFAQGVVMHDATKASTARTSTGGDGPATATNNTK